MLLDESCLPKLKEMLDEFENFSGAGYGLKLRSYQKDAAQAIIDSVIRQRGLTIVVIYPRQSGKNELQAHLEAYLLVMTSIMEGNRQNLAHLETAGPQRHAPA